LNCIPKSVLKQCLKIKCLKQFLKSVSTTMSETVLQTLYRRTCFTSVSKLLSRKCINLKCFEQHLKSVSTAMSRTVLQTMSRKTCFEKCLDKSLYIFLNKLPREVSREMPQSKMCLWQYPIRGRDKMSRTFYR